MTENANTLESIGVRIKYASYEINEYNGIFMLCIAFMVLKYITLSYN